MSEMSEMSEVERAKRQGAREALTWLAAEERADGAEYRARLIEQWRDKHVPAPRVRAVVKAAGGSRWELEHDQWRHLGVLYASPTRAEIADMFWAQQRADDEGFVVEDAGGLADSERSPDRQSDPASGKVKCERCGR